MDYIRDIPVLIPLWMIFTAEGVALAFRVRIIVCLVAMAAYLFSPLDIIPEAVFGLLGILDDIFIVFMLAVYGVYLYRNYLAHPQD